MIENIVGAISYCTSSLLADNFHEVFPQKLYRASKMRHDKLLNIINKFQISTVVDLRLQDKPDKLGVTKKEALSKAVCDYFHVPLRSTRTPTEKQIAQLFDVFDCAKPPVLLLCTSGVHRTGVATVIWLIEKEHVQINVAVKQLSPMYGFFKIERWFRAVVNGEPTLDDLIWRYRKENILEQRSFRHWVKEQLDIAQNESCNLSTIDPVGKQQEF
jgi:protein tyrosine phosphatase (PTP) superfamily phosphohydrolase (DUF442 family)